MNLCWLHGMYDGTIYIYNNAMLDYVTPLEELMALIMAAMATKMPLSQKHINLGNKILVYISDCLAGRAFPYGDIPLDRMTSVKYDIYNCLTTLHTKKSTESELTYPYLRALLHFDAQGLFNVISIAFQEADFKTEMGRRRKERLVDILLDIMVKSQSGDKFSPAQVGHLFTFLARQIASGEKGFFVDRALFDQVLEILTEAEDKSHHEERQQALLEMIRSGGMQYFEREKLIRQSEKVGFFRILETLYEESEEYEKVLQTFLSDEEPRRQQAFAFIQKVLLEESYNYEAKGKVEKSVIKSLNDLMLTNSKKTSSVIFCHMHSYIPLVMANLEDEPQWLYVFLKNCFELRDAGSQPTTPVHSANKEDVLTSEKTFELFIDLMCRFDETRVPSFLAGKSNFDLKKVLKICEKHEIDDAVAYLLESDGQILKAFDVLKKKLDNQLHQSPNKSLGKMNGEIFWARVNSSVIIIVQLCQRTMQILTESERETLWFSLLDSLISCQRNPGLSKASGEQLKDVIKHVISSTIGHVSLRAVIDKILRNPFYESGNFGDIRGFLTEMLETYHYEEVLLCATVDLVRSDLHESLETKRRMAGRALSCDSLECDLCRRHVALQGALLFQCGHKYHLSCLQKAGCVIITALGEEKWQCYKCLARQTLNSSETTEVGTIISALGDETSESKLNEDELESITNQDLVRAKAYIDKMKIVGENLISSFENRLIDENDENTGAVDQLVKLKLWPSPEDHE